ncbi:hypothetical protein RJ641_026135 [Dillenia turbinata]|uniref:Uncharacterized protein n=1 Tax=Dillenia turbinata TaxID=194707 RepID=A0AAN8ZSA7_9MAGN
MEGHMLSSNTKFSSNVPYVLEASRYPMKDPIFQAEIEANESKYMSFDAFDVEFNPERSTIICAYPKGESKEEAKTYMIVPEIRQCAKIIFTYKDGQVTMEKYPGNVLVRTRAFLELKAKWEKMKDFMAKKRSFKTKA